MTDQDQLDFVSNEIERLDTAYFAISDLLEEFEARIKRLEKRIPMEVIK